MGICYKPVLAIGKWFENEEEAKVFLRGHDLLSAQDMEDIKGSNLEEYLPCNMDGGYLDYFSGYGYYVGYKLSQFRSEHFHKYYLELLNNWNVAFNGKVEADIINEVCVY